jgi:hypothetical protein
MKISTDMLGDVAMPVSKLFPHGVEVTVENMQMLRFHNIGVERHVGLNFFHAKTLVRFVDRIEDARRRWLTSAFSDEKARTTFYNDAIIDAFVAGAKVYDEATKAYNDEIQKSGDQNAAIKAEWLVWDRE